MTPLFIFLSFLAGVSNAVMDRTKHRSAWIGSIWFSLPETNWWYKWASPNRGSRNKWKLDKNGKPTGKPRFPGSTSIFVFVTDAWHFFQFLWRRLFLALIILYGFYSPFTHFNLWIIPNWVFDAAFLSIAYLAAFNIFYDHIFKKNYNES